MDPKTLLIKWGPQHPAKGLERGFRELDNYIVGWPVQPSLVANSAATVLGAVGALMTTGPIDEILALWAGHHSTTLWDYLEGMITPPPALRAGTRTLIPSTGAYVPTRPGLTQRIRYSPEQRVVTGPKFIPGVLRPKYQHGA